MPNPPARDLIVVHSSDLHVDHDYTARLHGGDGTAGLGCVLKAAADLSADVVILAGDTFDSHRVPQDLVERAATVIAAAELPVVLLPGNHDPAIAAQAAKVKATRLGRNRSFSFSIGGTLRVAGFNE